MRPFFHAHDFGRFLRPRSWVLCLIPAIFFCLGASDPEVVKIRVPASKVLSWFPPGSDLQVLPPDRFEALLKAVHDRPTPRPASRLLRARHSARWESGLLVGRSDVTIEPSTNLRPCLVVLEPWSPAVGVQEAGTSSIRATADGRLAVKVSPGGPSTFSIDWRLRARPGSGGRAFALALPDLDVSSLVLDLPLGLEPEAHGGPRIGPEPGPPADRAIWRFEAARGQLDLRLRDPSLDPKRAGAPTLWLSGSTRIDLNLKPANWRADWTLDESPGAPRRLTIELDSTLELVDVSGPRVASFRFEKVDQGTRLEIRLDEGGTGPSPLTIRAICHAPAEGRWAVPSARSLDAIWTGGRTTVLLDESRVLEVCHERNGRRVAPRASDPVDVPTLIFEPKGEAGSVADLTFRKPSADATVEIRGRLRLGDEVPRIEAALTWTVDRGRILSRAVDLPPGWTPDRVQSTSGQHVDWHADRLSNDGTRVHISPSLPDDDSLSVTLTLGASALKAGVTGPLDLPRVRPVSGVRVVDEIWVATPDPKLNLRPTFARGLAWIDPPDPSLDDSPTPWVADDLRNALAWRWLAEDAEARIDRDLLPEHPRGEVTLNASIAPNRIQLQWIVAVDSPRGDSRSIPIHFNEHIEGTIRWKSRAAGGPSVTVRAIEHAERSKLGFPSTGSAFDLETSGPLRGRIELEGQFEQPWTGSGRLPLLTLPDRIRTRGLVSVVVEDSTRVKFDSSGLTPIARPSPAPDSPENSGATTTSSGPRTRRAAVFGYGSSGGRLSVETIRGDVEPNGGFIQEAYLVSQVSPGAGIRHRLTLKISPDATRSIELSMPQGSAVDRIRRDGQPIAPTSSGGPFRVEIPEPSPGRTSSTLTIDYETLGDLPGRLLEPALLVPRCSVPCLSFAWEIVAPDPWLIGEIGSGLVETNLAPTRSTASKILGDLWFPWTGPGSRPSAGSEEAIRLDLDKTALELADGEANLGDWLLKLDAGKRPIVVDRLALRSAGCGPGSRIDTSLDDPNSLGPSRSILQPLGLIAYALDGMILVTARGEIPDRSPDRGRWSDRLRDVPWVGSDPTDRFQSAARWRGEATPRALSAGESQNRPSGQSGWRTWRLVSTGWPKPGASARLIDSRTNRAWGWLVTLAVLAMGILSRNRSARFRGIALASMALFASLGLAWSWPEPATVWSSLVRGILAVMAIWLGRLIKPGPAEPPLNPREVSTTSRRSSFVGVRTALIVAAWLGLGSVVSLASLQAENPILALLPFDGPPDPMAKPDRVVLSLQDFERLSRLARPEEPQDSSFVTLQAVGHRVVRERPGIAIVESLYQVEAVGDGPASWTLPVGNSLDLSATVDEHPSPLRIAADGLSASVAIGGEGTHKLSFRRSIRLSKIGVGGERLTVPINRAAFARVNVARGEGSHWVEVPQASGVLEVAAEGIEGGLGPGDRLEVHWFPEDRSPSSAFRGAVDALFLWDAQPSGDLIRLKLSHSDPDGAATIRIVLEPGLLVRRYAIPNLVGVQVEGTAERPEWVAHVDPPLPKDQVVEIDFWRKPPALTSERRWPSIEIPTSGRFSAVLGFRRPVDWSGRLDARGAPEPVTEASFVRSWGELPDDGLTMAGAIRLGPSPSLDVAIRPMPLRRTVRSKVLVDLTPGQLNLVVDAVLSDRQGRSFELEMGLPAELRVTRVEAAGLVDWRMVARDRLRLQFDGSESVDRSIRVEGRLPVPADSVMTETRNYQTNIPWPRWLDAEEASGTLLLSSPTRFEFEPGDGVGTLPLVGPADPDNPIRAFFRVDRPSGLSPVKWTSLPSKVVVSVQSDLTIDAGHLTWTAAVACDVTGGPADSLHWNIPTDWAEGATLEIEGIPHRRVSERKGTNGEVTLWTILPESPIWGRARMVLRSKRRLEPGVQFNYPELSPLAAIGRGSVERYDLAIANVSGHPMEVAGSPGLQPIDVSRFRGEEPASPPGSIDHAYQVTGGRWWLRVRVGRSGDTPIGSGQGETARVSLAQLSCSVGEQGELFGRARYDLEPRPAPFLAVGLVESAEVLWAAVDGVIEPVLHEGPGRWLIPLGDRNARRVVVCWRAVGVDHLSKSPQGLACPTLDQADVPTLVSVTAPESIQSGLSSSTAERLNRADWEAETADQLARKFVGALSELDRGSRRDREQLLEDLIEIELRDRSLARAPEVSKSSVSAALGRIQTALASVVEASQTNGLEELIQGARARIGLGRDSDESTAEPLSESTEPVRIRRIGNASFFRSLKSGAGRPIPITWNLKATSSNKIDGWLIASTGLFIAVLIGFAISRAWIPVGRLAVALTILVVLSLVVVEPLGTSLAMALVGLGRATR
jgi:hypothetical protein